ncbi:YL1 nuclear protein-domain-containing protein [Umbelopsis sp. AD052]|nr:YL1 nuclear protein-domain-containing protein [Umbelopsis sp. AD052]
MSLVETRERRANAGSRMKALLNDEAEMEDLFEAIESDEEFENAVEEEDIVDSDFDVESGDSEVEREAEGEQEDKMIEKEERQARKVVVPTHKPPAVAAAKKQVSIRETKQQEIRVVRALKPSMAESMASAPRQSSRSATLKNRQQVEEQLKEYEHRRALLPKRDKPVIKTLTQEEMLAEAVITEQANKASLENWQQMEAERMAKAKRREKQGIIGPFIRYFSYTDGEESERPRKKRIMVIEEDHGNNVVREITDKEVVEWMEKDVLEKSDMIGRNLISFEGDFTSPQPIIPHNRRAAAAVDTEMYDQDVEYDLSNLSDGELDRIDLIPALTPWLDKELRPIQPSLCPVTSKVAHYKDPATGVPYADPQAFQVLRDCLNHKNVWSEVCNAFVTLPGHTRGAKGVPEGWEYFSVGKLDGQPDWMIDGKVAMPEWFKKLRGIPEPMTESTMTDGTEDAGNQMDMPSAQEPTAVASDPPVETASIPPTGTRRTRLRSK